MAQDALLASTRAVPARLEAMGFTFRDPLIAPALSKML
jgi:NAD dependent epimerase/dehydratase family enzyme